MQQLTREADAELFRSLLSRLNEVQQLQNIQSRPVHVLSPATVPTKASGAGPFDYAVMAFIGVVLLGFGAVTGRELTSDRMRLPVQVAERGLEIVAVTPRLGTALQKEIVDGEGEGGGAQDPKAELFFDAMRRLLNLTAPERAGRSVALLLASNAVGDGVSTTAFGLARTVGRSGRKAVVVETDLTFAPRGEAQHAGLAGVLTGEVALDDALVKLEDDGGAPFWVLPSASDRAYPAELLASERMATLMAALRERFDVIVLDASPVGESADAEVLAPYCDGTLLVMRYGTSLKLVQSSLDLMERVTDNTIGVLVTWAPDRFFRDVYGTQARPGWFAAGRRGLQRASPFTAVVEQQALRRTVTKLPDRPAPTGADGSRKNVR